MPSYLDIFKHYFGSGQPLTESQLSFSPEEIEQLRRLSEMATNKPMAKRGSIEAKDYLLDTKNPSSIRPDLNLVNLMVGRIGVDPRYGNSGNDTSYIRREGNNWRIRDWYDWNPNNKDGESNIDAAKRLIKKGIVDRDIDSFKQAINPISRQIKGDKHGFQIDFTVPMSQEQIKRLGNNELTIGKQQYYYEPYKFAQGETVEQAIQKRLSGNRYKPEGADLQKYVNMVKQRNQVRGQGDTAYYIPVVKQELIMPKPTINKPKFSAMDLLAEHLGKINLHTGF